jgi:hypothetical protein
MRVDLYLAGDLLDGFELQREKYGSGTAYVHRLPLPRWILPVLMMHISELSLLISVVKTRVARVEDVHSFGSFYKGPSPVKDHHGHNEL